jgi:hypothetical protein
MKSKFEIYNPWQGFSSIIKKHSDIEDVYKKYYAEDGFEFIPINDSLYKIYDKEYNLSIGDYVYLNDHFRVCDKWVDLEKDYVFYMLAGSGEEWQEYVSGNIF